MPDITPDLCDAYPELDVLEPRFRNFGGRKCFAGEVVTIKCHEDNSLVKDWCAKPGKGRVLVVDGGGSMRCALLGDQVAAQAAENGWAGLVIYGCIRDICAISSLDLGVQALGTHPRKTEKKGVGEQGRVLHFAGTYIHPGDHLVADDNGILISRSPLDLSAYAVEG